MYLFCTSISFLERFQRFCRFVLLSILGIYAVQPYSNPPFRTSSTTSFKATHLLASPKSTCTWFVPLDAEEGVRDERAGDAAVNVEQRAVGRDFVPSRPRTSVAVWRTISTLMS